MELSDNLVVRADLETPDTGATPEAGDLETVEREATRLASRLARLGGALDGFSQEARSVDDAQAHRLAVLAAAVKEVR